MNRKTFLAHLPCYAVRGSRPFTVVESIPPGYWYDEAHKSIVAFGDHTWVSERRSMSPIFKDSGSGYFWLLAGVFQNFRRQLLCHTVSLGVHWHAYRAAPVRSIKKLYGDDRLALLSAGVLGFYCGMFTGHAPDSETIAVCRSFRFFC